MQDASSYEFWAQKNDASLFVTGLHSKKRPDNLVFTRMYDGRVLDMVELGIEAAKGIKDFAVSRDPVRLGIRADPWQGVKAALASRPLMVFHSDLFDTHPTFQSLKSHLLDFYNGHPLTEYPLTTIEHVISITAAPLPPSSSAAAVPDSPAALPLVHLRVYTIRLQPTSAGRAPRFELTEMGPALDFRIRRVQDADPGQMKAALKRPKLAKKDVEGGLGKKRKNVETDDMGDKVGKLHVGKQDLSKLQGRKMKGLKVHKEGGIARAVGGMEVDADA